jgi:hypothetical protein
VSEPADQRAELKRVRERLHGHGDALQRMEARIATQEEKHSGHEILCTERWRVQQQQRTEDKQAHENWKAEIRESLGRVRDKIEAGEKLQDTRHDANQTALSNAKVGYKTTLLAIAGTAILALAGAAASLLMMLLQRAGQ